MVKAEQTLIRRGNFNATMSLGDIQDKCRQACPGETSRQAMPQRAQSGIGRTVGQSGVGGHTGNAAVDYQTGRAAVSLDKAEFPHGRVNVLGFPFCGKPPGTLRTSPQTVPPEGIDSGGVVQSRLPGGSAMR